MKRCQNNVGDVLFNSVLTIQPDGLTVTLILLLIYITFIKLALQSRVLLALRRPLTVTQKVSTSTRHAAFVILLTLIINASVRTVNMLLVDTFIIVPTYTTHLLDHAFANCIILSTLLKTLKTILNVILSTIFGLPSKPTVIAVRLTVFLKTVIVPQGGLSTIWGRPV